MKKLFFALVLVSVAGLAIAQTTKADKRKEAREARIAKTIDVMKAAVAGQDFLFIPTQMQLAYQDPIEMGNLNMTPFVDVTPDGLTVNMPFSMQMYQPNSRVFDLYLPGVNYSYKVTAGKGYNYIINIGLTNVSNQNASFMPVETQNINLNIHIVVDVRSSFATMTITPTFGAPTVYLGTIAPNDK